MAAASGIISPFSSVPLVPPALLIWGETKTALFLAGGWLLGGMIAYALSSLVGHPFMEYFVSSRKIDYYRERLSRGSRFWIVFLFRLALPSELASYILDALRYPFGKYLFITLVTELLFTIITVSMGETILDKKPMLFIALGAGTFLMVSGIIYLFHHRLPEKNQPVRGMRS